MTSRSALGVLLLAAGGLWLLDVTGVLELSYRTWVAVLLIAIGVLIVIVPRGRGLLVLVGILIALVGAPAFVVDEELLEGGIGESTENPKSASDLEPFRQAIGKLTVDLTAPGLELDEQVVEASVGIGDLLVVVPLNTDVTVDAHVGIGNARVLVLEPNGEEENGFDVDLDTGPTTTSGSQEVKLELEVGIGDLRVERG